MMATVVGDDIPVQLASLLGGEVVQIRKTDENPPRISVIDVVQAITGQTQSNSAGALRRLRHDHPEVVTNCSKLKFKGERQRDTPVTDAKAKGMERVQDTSLRGCASGRNSSPVGVDTEGGGKHVLSLRNCNLQNCRRQRPQ